MDQQVSSLRAIDKGFKIYKCKEFLYGKELSKLAMMLPKTNGHEIDPEEMNWKEDFSHEVCWSIVLEVATHCVRESTWDDEECVEEYEECRIKNDKER